MSSNKAVNLPTYACRVVNSRVTTDGVSYSFAGEVVYVNGHVTDHLLIEYPGNGDCKLVRYSQLSSAAQLVCREAIASWERGSQLKSAHVDWAERI